MLTTPMNKYRAAITEALTRLISIKSVKAESSLNMPYGKGVFKALMYMLDLSEKLDLESCNLFGHMGYAEYGSGEQTLALLTHLDVVPAGDGWESDPFKAVIKDGKLYGRGAVDNKGAAIASLFALYAIKESCITLNKKVRIMFGCDEESGWKDIEFYKEHYEVPDLVISPDASFPIFNSEKGLLHMNVSAPVRNMGCIKDILSGTRVNIVPAKANCLTSLSPEEAERLCADAKGAKMYFAAEEAGVRIYSEGIAAHGAHPELGVNSLTHLISALKGALSAEGDIERFIFALDELIGLEIRGETLGIAASDEISGALSVNLGAISVENGEITAKIDVRTPISTNVSALYEKLSALFSERGMSTSIIHIQEPHHVPEDTELVRSLKKAYKSCFNMEAECRCCAGATYARAFKNGVAFGPVMPGKDECEHGPNENIAIDDVIKLSEALAFAIIEIAGEGGEGL